MQEAPNVTNKNILSAAASIITAGLATFVPAIKTGMEVWAVVAGLMVGGGLALAYLGAQWEVRTKVIVALATVTGVVASCAVSVAVLAIQGNLVSL